MIKKHYFIVVTLAGSPTQLLGAAVQAYTLRHCAPPHNLNGVPHVPIPHYVFQTPSDLPMSRVFEQAFAELGSHVVRLGGDATRNPWAYKIDAIRAVDAEHVLFLDCDSYPMMDPRGLLNHPGYVQHGAMFWRDFATRHADVPGDIARTQYAAAGIEHPPRSAVEFESGQMLFRPDTVASALDQMSAYMEEWRRLFSVFHGDKDLWRMAWLKTKTPIVLASPDIGIVLDEHYNGRVIKHEVCMGGEAWPAFQHWCNAKLGFHGCYWHPDLGYRVINAYEKVREMLVKLGNFTEPTTDAHESEQCCLV